MLLLILFIAFKYSIASMLFDLLISFKVLSSKNSFRHIFLEVANEFPDFINLDVLSQIYCSFCVIASEIFFKIVISPHSEPKHILSITFKLSNNFMAPVAKYSALDIE